MFACDVNILYAACMKHALDFKELTREAKVAGWIDTNKLSSKME